MSSMQTILNHEIATNEELVEFCSPSNANRKIVFSIEGGCTIVRLSHTAVVKYGPWVTEREFQNQRMARNLVDSAIIRIPEVYRFFEFNYIGYFVMEFVDGKTFAELHNPLDYKDSLLEMLEHFLNISGTQAGPLAGGPARGPVWAECGSFSPTTTEDIEKYLNKRISRKNKSHLSLQQRKLVFCHQDLADRNLVFPDHGPICIMDWESAGFYPPVFELCGLLLNKRQDGDLASFLSQLFPLRSDLDKQDVRLILKASARDLTHWK